MRRGAAAQADATALAPDPGGANIYPATVAKQGRRWREASSQKAFEAPPHPSQKTAQSEPHSSPIQKASYIPSMHTYPGVTSTHPNLNLATGQRTGLGGI